MCQEFYCALETQVLGGKKTKQTLFSSEQSLQSTEQQLSADRIITD